MKKSKNSNERLNDSTIREYIAGRLSELPRRVLYNPNNNKMKACKECRKHFTYKAHNTLYCEPCKQRRKTRSYRHSKRKSRQLDVQKVDL